MIIIALTVRKIKKEGYTRLWLNGCALDGAGAEGSVNSGLEAAKTTKRISKTTATIDRMVLMIPVMSPARLRLRLDDLRAKATLARMIAGIPVINPRPVNEIAPRIIAAMASGSSGCAA